VDAMKPMKLLKKGAEANLYLADWHDRKVVFKKRLPKKYRQAQLDAQIRVYRTIHEPQLMHEAKRAGVFSPMIFLVDVKNTFIVMEYIEGTQVKQLLYEISEEERRNVCFKIGQDIAKLHRFGLIHGDLTTSNMIMNSEGRVFFVDFGLGEKDDGIEARGVDLHLMKMALQSTHYQFAGDCFKSVIDGYGSIMDVESLKSVLRKVKEIERRGRYVAERKQQEVTH
jgi:TP53 regulating kinase and related kinases